MKKFTREEIRLEDLENKLRQYKAMYRELCIGEYNNFFYWDVKDDIKLYRDAIEEVEIKIEELKAYMNTDEYKEGCYYV